MNDGDLITIDGVYRKIPNRDREWWQFWKARFVTTDEPQTFRVIGPRKGPDPHAAE